jgi:hypothetical protein
MIATPANAGIGRSIFINMGSDLLSEKIAKQTAGAHSAPAVCDYQR